MKPQILIGMVAVVATVATQGLAQQTTGISADEARTIATEAYVYGYPLITMEMTGG